MKKPALGIALVPDDSAIGDLCALNSGINREFPSSLVLCKKGRLLPHLSLFQGGFPEKSLPAIADVASRAAQLAHGIEGKPTGISLWAGKIFFLEMAKSRPLSRLHAFVLCGLNPLREKGTPPADNQEFSGISRKERSSLEKYSYPFAAGAFRPHFTIGRCKKTRGSGKEFAHALWKKRAIKKIRFALLSVFKVGKYGRFERQLLSFPLHLSSP